MKVAGRTKKVIDALMVAALLLLMSYGLIGEKVHELLGIGMILLFGIHHILNRHWYKSLGKGRYSAARLLSVAVDMLLIVVMIALPVSGCGLWHLCFFPEGDWAVYVPDKPVCIF